MAINDQEFDNLDQEEKTLQEMEAHAGGFVKGLSGLYRLADGHNRRKLRETFWGHFVRYIEWTKKEHTHE